MNDVDKPLMVGILLMLSLLFGMFALGFTNENSPFFSERYGLTKLDVGGTGVLVEVAATDDARARGLGGREHMRFDRGMLFVFDTTGKYPIWMKGMQFPLDVYWINEDGVIVDMWQNAQPSSYPSIYAPHNEARYILEVIAGFSEVYNIQTGDVVGGLPQL